MTTKANSMSKSRGKPVERLFAPFQKTIDQLWAHFRDEEGSTTILVSSVDERAGSTTVACCTAIGLAHHLLAPTVLVETHMGSSGLARLFGLSQSPGLSEVLDGSVELEDALGDSGVPNLRILSFGYPRHRGVSAAAFHDLFLQLQKEFRFVVLDTAPVLEQPNTRVMLKDVDKALLVLESNRSNLDNATHAIEVLEESGVEMVGTVLNKYRPEAPGWLLPSRWNS